MSGVQILIVLLLVVLALFVVGALLGLALELLWLALVGLVIGALARMFVSGTSGMSLLATALYGVAGSLLGGIVGDALDAGWFVTFVLAVVAAALLIVALGRRGVAEPG